MSVARGKRELTGWHVLAIMVSFFSVVIAVNLTMAFFARSSWTGLIVDNVHVAGREFNAKAAEGRAQAALGWKPELVIADGKLSYRLADAQGKAVPAAQATVSFRRPAYASEDHEVTLTRQLDGSLAAPVELRDGLWIVEIRTEAGLERPYRDVRRLQLRGGAVQ
ncbi:FixH family protein [Bosea sp. (in: a-proteobacteria)]|uniref:FixH family protein n=1 Tax=Bosea sp. (in: a-proteobacteria) TaxID=1871050 RepID=UPI00260A471B|nr:FixH family protein [Bosea sp. (in: a-proteobacteria)]MCO5093545.1 FixH family protein [Bosea sp. (in: a-proteobacteria)]